MVTRIAAGRKAREIDPAEAALKACVARAAHDPQLSADAKARLADMLDFVTTMGRWHDEMLSVPKPALMRLIRLGAGVTKLINRSEEHTSELQSLMRISYAVFCLTKKKYQEIALVITTS